MFLSGLVCARENDSRHGNATDYYLRTGPDQPFEKNGLKKKTPTELAPSGKEKALEAFCKTEKIGKNLPDDEAAQIPEFLEQ